MIRELEMLIDHMFTSLLKQDSRDAKRLAKLVPESDE